MVKCLTDYSSPLRFISCLQNGSWFVYFILSFLLILTPLIVYFIANVISSTLHIHYKHFPRFLFPSTPRDFFSLSKVNASQNMRAQIKKVNPKLYAYLNSAEKKKTKYGIENLFFFSYTFFQLIYVLSAATGTQKIHCIKLWQSQLIVQIACYVNEFAEIDFQHDEEWNKKYTKTWRRYYNHWYRA